MHVADPYANRNGESRTVIAGTLGELAAHMDEIGRSVRVSVYVSAEVALAEISPRATGDLLAALSDAGLAKQPTTRRPRAPKASAPKASAAKGTRKRSAPEPSAPMPDAGAAERDALIAAVIAQLDARK